MTKHEAIALELHDQGYSCAQSVLGAFDDVCGVDRTLLLKLTTGFGSGIANLHEVCGALSGMFMAADLIYGEGSNDRKLRVQNDYPRIAEMAEKFRSENGALTCRDLKGMDGAERRMPAGKTCVDLVRDAARILDEYIESHPVPER